MFRSLKHSVFIAINKQKQPHVCEQGVNGLYDMGANVWEWVNSESVDSKVTAGGSWWYEAFRMHRDDRAVKPKDTAVVYIGFRCATDVR